MTEYKITMVNGKIIEVNSEKDLDTIIKESECSLGINITNNIWIISKHIVSIEVINER